MKKLWLLLLCTSCSFVKIEPVKDYVYKINPKLEYSCILEDGFIYDWDESTLGPIGYTEPNLFYASIYQNGEYYTSKKCDSTSIEIYNNSNIDVIVSNVELKDQTTIKLPKTNQTGFPFLEQLPFYEQPNEIFIGKQFFLSNVNLYNWHTEKDGSYWTNLTTNIIPATNIYIIQIIVNNSDVVCDSLIVSGVACELNVLNKQSIKGNVFVSLQEKQIKESNTVYAARLLSFGLGNTEQNSWDISESLKTYLAFKISNKKLEKYIKIDITKKIIKPGGLITIKIEYSNLNGGMDLDINDWNVQEIEINL